MGKGFEEDGVQPVRQIKLAEREINRTAVNRETSSANKTLSGSKEIKIKVNPGQIVRVGLTIVVLLGVFFLGRLSANNFELTGLTTSETVTTVTEGSTAEAAAPTETATTKGETAVEEEDAALDKSNEPIVNSYKNTKISLDGVSVDWKGDWGQITHLAYVIQNGEDGSSIQPWYFKIMVEGYEDVEKVATLSEEKRLIHSGESQVGEIALDKPFNYNEKVTGNLDNVDVRVVLFSVDEKPMASFRSEYNLKR